MCPGISMASVPQDLSRRRRAATGGRHFVATVGSLSCLKDNEGTRGASVSMPSLRLAYHDDSSFESEAKVQSLQCWVGEGPKRRLTDSLPASSSTSMFLGALLPAAAPHADSRVGHFAAILIIHIITRLPGHTGHLQPGLLPRAQNCYSVPLSQPLKINLPLPQSPLTARPWCLSKVFLPHR